MLLHCCHGASTRQSELAARAAGGERASVEESVNICFQCFLCVPSVFRLLARCSSRKCRLFGCTWLLFVFLSSRFPFTCQAGFCFGSPRGLQALPDAPRCPLKLPRRSQELPKTALRGPTRPQKAAKRVPRDPYEGPRAPIRTHKPYPNKK